VSRKAFDKRWKDWVRQNVARGCSLDEMSRILAAEGFHRGVIERELGYAPPEEPAPASDPAPLSGTSIRIPRLERFAAPGIELYTAENFLDASECEALIAGIKANLRPSTISSAEYEPDAFFRTSRTCDLSASIPVVARVDHKICAGLRISPSYAEPTQGQYYEAGQEFKRHTDYFEAHELERFCTQTWGQRNWTFMVYLNEPDGGGETEFVEVGLTVRPRTGLAVLWNNLRPNGRPNPLTMHRGAPVTAGNKAIITKWFRLPRVHNPEPISRWSTWGWKEA
jgi:prolyl 4-hydroxylase